MHIHRIAVRNWRGLDELAIDDLAPGLNLVSGPNESGKSRLVQALWFGLFESSKGKAQLKQDLQTHGLGSEKPWVSIDFELAGKVWTVEKLFLGTGTNTELRSGSERFDGEEAEAALRELMRVSEPSTTGLKSEDAGIWPYLWVEQHESADPPTESAGDDARGHLQDRLTAEVGEVAAGERGQALLQRARDERDRFYTSGRGDETGALREARARREACEEAFEEARIARAAIAGDADRLQAARGEQKDLDERVTEADAARRDALAKETAARAARETLTDAERAEETARLKLRQAEQGLADRKATEAQLAERSERVATLTSDREAALGNQKAAETAAAGRDEAVRSTDQRAETARTALDQLRKAERRSADSRSLRTLRAQLAEAREINARVAAATEALAATPEVSEDDVRELSELRDARAEARARLDGAAVRLTLDAERLLTVDGEAIEAGASRQWTIDEDRTLVMEGVGRLRIEPGAGELAELRDALRDAETELAARLRELEVADLPAAQAARDKRRELDQALAVDRAALKREAPEGLDPLASAVRELEVRLELEPGAEPPADETADEEAIAAADREESAARVALAEARASRDEANEALQDVRAEGAALKARLDEAKQEQAAQTQRLEAMPAAEVSEGAVNEAATAVKAAEARSAEARTAFEAHGGDAAADDVERLEKSVAQLQQQRIDLGQEISVLEDRLRSAGDEGRHETVQEREAELEQARADLARIERQAKAARRLFEVLDAASREARERLAGPVVERIGPYLADLFPGTEVWLDQSMNLQGLRTDRTEARFDELSGGAREQLALLVRIGLAEVLGAEESWPLVLDDALVNTDPERIERLQRLLYQASKKMQILLFTCHGRLYDAVGADRRIELAARPRTDGAR